MTEAHSTEDVAASLGASAKRSYLWAKENGHKNGDAYVLACQIDELFAECQRLERERSEWAGVAATRNRNIALIAEQRDDAIAEVQRLRAGLQRLINAKDMGEVTFLVPIILDPALTVHEQPVDVSDIEFDTSKAGTGGEHEPDCGCPVCDDSNRGNR